MCVSNPFSRCFWTQARWAVCQHSWHSKRLASGYSRGFIYDTIITPSQHLVISQQHGGRVSAPCAGGGMPVLTVRLDAYTHQHSCQGGTQDFKWGRNMLAYHVLMCSLRAACVVSGQVEWYRMLYVSAVRSTCWQHKQHLLITCCIVLWHYPWWTS
jgi:hypothetical protein